uniref:Retrotransposon protein, putative, Ty3-gypsy subclass n=1 Tax=Oryza sativa subsp. japonica TaxID=39947 RepID=Q338N0_ORYSJ|nr:retrotransposon protein, putative, Ty3-gypsy subclass [Oryza sativa Japonica Group]
MQIPELRHQTSTVARQVGGLGAQGSTTMSSSFVDNNVNTNLNQGFPASTMLVWTQVGEIVFPVYTTMPISAGSSMTGNENAVVTTQDDSMSKDPPAEAENGTSTTSELEKDSNAAKPCRSDKDHEPTRMTSEATSCKVFLSAMKTPSPKVQQSHIPIRDKDKEQGATPISDRFVGVIDINPHEPSFLHLLEDYGSSTTSAPREVLAIDDVGTSARTNAEAENQVTTPAQHIRAVNAILRETPYDPVLNDDLARWIERLRESVANLGNAFEEAAAAARPEQPPTGDANGENPEQRESPHRATPPPRGTGDLRDHLNGCREARRTRDNENRSRHRVSSRRHNNEERGGHSSEDRHRDSRHPTTITTIVNSGRRAILVEDVAIMTTMVEIGAETTAGDGDRILENPADVLVLVRRNQATHRHRHHPRDLHQIDIHEGHLWQQFVANFQGTYKRHAIEDDLHALTQNPGESLRDYVRRFNECRNTIPEITDASVIHAFKSGVRDRYTTQELATRRITTTRRLFEIVDRCAHADDALRRKNDKPKTGGDKKPAKDAPESSKKKNRKSGKSKAQAEVLAAEYANPPKRPDPQGSDAKKAWCPIHKMDRHSLEDCLVFKKSLEKHMAFEKGKRVRVVEKDAEAAAQELDSAYPDSDLHVSHIFGGSTAYSSKREYKKVEREVCSTWQGAAPKMKWCEQKIEFSEEDHPKTAVIPGRYPIVVEPTIRNIKVARVLIDGGSSINLLFASALDAMRIPRSELTPTDQPFHGITPHVNAIIGRTALAKFMAVSHYAYQVLKMPGPKGTITIQGNAKLLVQCDKRSLDMVEQTPSLPATTEPPKKVSKTNKTPKPDGVIKIVPLSSANPDKTVKIGASLSEK